MYEQRTAAKQLHTNSNNGLMLCVCWYSSMLRYYIHTNQGYKWLNRGHTGRLCSCRPRIEFSKKSVCTVFVNETTLLCSLTMIHRPCGAINVHVFICDCSTTLRSAVNSGYQGVVKMYEILWWVAENKGASLCNFEASEDAGNLRFFCFFLPTQVAP